jgi:alkylation response protein AidB-like acyl-CoA dehydrogenase
MTALAPPTALVTELAAGRVPWPLLADFPDQQPDERLCAERVIGELTTLLDDCLDAERLEQDGRLPNELFGALHRAGFLACQLPRADGGLELSDYSTFRLLQASMELSPAAGFALAVHNGIGLPALLPTLPDGPLASLVRRRLVEGAVSGWADTEPAGAANTFAATIAEPTGDGGYRLTGEKAFIGNGTIAAELIVSATVPAPPGSPAQPDGCLFLVDTTSQGFRVRTAQDLLGLRGLPLGVLQLAGVPVPAERVIDGPGGHWRDSELLDAVSSRGRTYLVAGAALAIGRRCLGFQRDFAIRRRVDGRLLGDYPATRRLLADSLADLYAADSVVRWGLLGDDALLGRHRDRVAVKNLTTRACWRIVERTMSLMATEGLETVASKRRHGVVPLPVEQLFRDARVLRIAGGVDYAVDLWAGEALVADRSPAAQRPGSFDSWIDPAGRVLAAAQRLARAIDGLAARYPDRQQLLEQQAALIAAGRISGELLAMVVTLARSAGATAESGNRQRLLAGRYYAAADRRLASLWPDLEQPEAAQAEVRQLSDWWLAEDAEAALL